MFDIDKKTENEENLIFIDPVRFRYNYMVEYIHANRTQFYALVDEEERNFSEENY
jgi:hypothetical protein